MSIFLTPATAATEASRIKAKCTLLKNHVLSTYNYLMMTVYHNQNGISSDDIFQALGVDDTNTLKALACLSKTMANVAVPNSIVDQNPVGTYIPPVPPS